MKQFHRSCHFLTLPIGLLAITTTLCAQDKSRQISLIVVDSKSAKPVPCRVHLKDAAGKPVQPPDYPFWRDHFVCPGEAQLNLLRGDYLYEIERGPEYRMATGLLRLNDSTEPRFTVKLERYADLAAEGWWPGDLHVHRPVKDIELLMSAEDLYVAPVITWWNNRNHWATNRVPENPLVRFDRNRFYHVMGGEDEREGGALLYFHLKEPLRITPAKPEYPSPMLFLQQARKFAGVWVDMEKPFWWDVPTWLASGQTDSIGLANNHMCRDQMLANEAWGKPRDAQRLPPPRGNGFWTQEIYYHILNCGLRIPPSAGSASGVLPNPVGYDRVYVYLGRNFDYAKWWEGLRAGQSFVSNGPLLRCRADGKLPGHVFSGREGKEVKIEITAALSTRDPISSIEVIKNGRLERAVPFAEWQKTGKLGSLNFQESGWFLVRAITDNPKTFRFASTAPYYVEIGNSKRRISRASAQFFLDWVRERQQRVKLDNPQQRGEVLEYHDLAEKFWSEVLAKANAG